MKAFVVWAVLGVGTGASAQSLHFRTDGRIPFDCVAESVNGRVVEPRIDVLRCKRDWDEYYSAQNGFFGGPAFTSLKQPDFCAEQVIAINLGGDGTFGQLPRIRSVRDLDGWTWEVVVDIRQPVENPMKVAGQFSPYVAVRTPLGPDDFDIVFLSNEGRQIVELRSAPRYTRLARDWWRPRDRREWR